MKTTNVVSPEVKTVLVSNRVAGLVFEHLATRRNNANETLTRTCENLFGDKGVKRTEITQCWKSLEEAGCGRFIEGRRGRESRFAWAGNLKTRQFCHDAILAL